MNRTLLIVAGMFGASGPVLMDSAVKGTALLVVAAIAALTLRRDSAATRHLVWLLAMAAMLVVPVLSAMLPRWRVLPEWVRIPPRGPWSRRTARDGQARRWCDGTGAACRSRGRRIAIRDGLSTGRQTARFPARVGDAGGHSRVGCRELELARRTDSRVGPGFLRAHPAAAGLALDAREDRAARDGHRVVRATVADSPSLRKCPGSRVLAAQDRATGHPVDSPGPDHSAWSGASFDIA